MIIAGDTAKALGARWLASTLPPFLLTRPAAVLTPAVLIMLPLSLKHNMGSLAPASSLAVAVMALTCAAIAFRALQDTSEATAAAGRGHPAGGFGMFAAVPIIVFAYQCHVQAVPIFRELTAEPRLWPLPSAHASQMWQFHPFGYQSDDPDSRVLLPPQQESSTGDSQMQSLSQHVSSPPPPLSRVNAAAIQDNASHSGSSSEAGHAAHLDRVYSPCKVAGMAQVLAAASLECTILYLVTGAAGYHMFAESALANVLNNFPPSDNLIQLMQGCVGFAVTLHYPINLHAARSAVYDLFCEFLGLPLVAEPPYHHIAATAVFLWVGTAVTACLVSNLGTVFQIIGGVAGSVVIFVLPGALLIAEVRSTVYSSAQTSSPVVASEHVPGGPDIDRALWERVGLSAALSDSRRGVSKWLDTQRRRWSHLSKSSLALCLRVAIGLVLVSLGCAVITIALLTVLLS
jgi:hypothetical protein